APGDGSHATAAAPAHDPVPLPATDALSLTGHRRGNPPLRVLAEGVGSHPHGRGKERGPFQRAGGVSSAVAAFARIRVVGTRAFWRIRLRHLHSGKYRIRRSCSSIVLADGPVEADRVPADLQDAARFADGDAGRLGIGAAAPGMGNCDYDTQVSGRQLIES